MVADSSSQKATIGKICSINSPDNLTSMSLFFHSVDQIRTVNERLLTDLRLGLESAFDFSFFHLIRARVDSWNDATSKIGDLFSGMAPFFSMYSEYTNTQEFAAKTLAEQREVGSNYHQKYNMIDPTLMVRKRRNLGSF